MTLQTIADRLGVSRTTISNTYGRPGQLNPALRQSILDLAKELGYSGPHAAARSLRRGRSGSLGAVLTESLAYAVTDAAALLFLRGIAEASEPAGTALLLLPAPHGRRAGAAAVLDAVVDGFLVYSAAEDDERLQAVLERRLPTVMVDQPPQPDAGYADAVRQADLRWEDVPVQETPLNSTASGEIAAAALLDRIPRPTAILAFTDLLTIGAMRAAGARGLHVPEALSVAGFDDIPRAATVHPPLTTMRQPLLGKGLAAGCMILEGWPRDEPPSVLLPTELVVRASTGPAPP